MAPEEVLDDMAERRVLSAVFILNAFMRISRQVPICAKSGGFSRLNCFLATEDTET